MSEGSGGGKDALTREILRFLQLLNENHFEAMQAKMAELEGENFIDLVVVFL